MIKEEEPVTLWMEQLRQLDDVAAGKLWSHFIDRLHRSARTKLLPKTRQVYDEEDAAQSVFYSICEGILAGRFPDLRYRDCLWRLMLTITSQKISNRHRYDMRQRRDARRTTTESLFLNSYQKMSEDGGLVSNREATPEFAAEFADVCESLFRSLDDSALKEVAVLRIEGYTDAEIADQLNCSRRTVQRRLEMIRRQWEELNFSGG